MSSHRHASRATVGRKGAIATKIAASAQRISRFRTGFTDLRAREYGRFVARSDEGKVLLTG